MGLDIQDLRGQGYDGASNMPGVITGVAKQIQDISPPSYIRTLLTG